MKSPLHILLPALCLAGGWLMPTLWLKATPAPASGETSVPATGPEPPPRHPAAKSKSPPEANAADSAGERLPAAALALAGLTAAPSLEDIFQVEGADRRLRLALFLQTADAASCQALLSRLAPADALLPAPDSDKAEDSLIAAVRERWVELDPAAALAAGGEDPLLWAAWARLDADAALAAAAKSPSGLAEVIRVLGQRDPARARELIAAHPELTARADPWRGVAENLALRDPAAAVALAYEKKAGWREILTQWSAENPQAAFAWASALEDGPEKRRSTEAVIREWTRADPAAGLEAARKLPPGQSSKILTSQALQALARKDADSALLALKSLPASMAGQNAIAALADGLRSSRPEAAFEVLRKLQWDALYSQKGLSYSYSTGGSRGGSRMVDESVDFEKLVENFTDLAPRSTAEAIAPQAGHGEGTYALAISLGGWLKAAPEEASAWIRDLPPGPAKETGIESVVQSLSSTAESADCRSALAWAATAGPKKRQLLLEETLENWQKIDAPSATAAAEEYGVELPPPPDPDDANNPFNQ